MRGSRRVAGSRGAVVIALASVLAACSVEPPHEDVHAGWGREPQLRKDLAHFRVALPRRTDDLAWADNYNWDTTSVTLVFDTDDAGVRTVLARLRLPRRELRPLEDHPPSPIVLGDHVKRPVPSWRGARERHSWAPTLGGADMITSSDVTLVPAADGTGTTTVLLHLRNGT
jgi:hypothetical protein